MHAFLTIQFGLIIELNIEDQTWKLIPTLFAAAVSGEGRVNNGLIRCKQLCAHKEAGMIRTDRVGGNEINVGSVCFCNPGIILKVSILLRLLLLLHKHRWKLLGHH